MTATFPETLPIYSYTHFLLITLLFEAVYIIDLPGSYFSVMDHEDGDSRCLRNFGKPPQDYCCQNNRKNICVFAAERTIIHPSIISKYKGLCPLDR